ncbi:MAG: hypothetical protein K2X93_00740 [Candidatus Obscuribacterales bacterium]|nr:hypothetical protein [Candidatus Obscuribacterales bacterium]
MLDLSMVKLYSIEAASYVFGAVLLLVLCWLGGGHIGTRLARGGSSRIVQTQLLLSVSWVLSFTCAIYHARERPVLSFVCVLLFTTSLGIALGLMLKEWDGKNSQLASSGATYKTTLVCCGLVLGNAMAESLHAATDPVYLCDRFPMLIAVLMVAVTILTGLLVMGVYYGTLSLSKAVPPTADGSPR